MLRQSQLGEIRLVAGLGLTQDRFAAVGDVTTQQGGARRLRQGIQPRPDPRHAVQRGRLIARPHVHRHRQPGVRHQRAVIAVRRSPGLLRVVTHHRAFLLAVQALHRRIQIQNPRRGQQRLRRFRQVPVEPGHARRFVHPCARPSRRILRDESCHAQ